MFFSGWLTMLSTHQWWELKKEAEKAGLDEKLYATWVKIMGYLVVFKDKRRFGILVVGLVHDSTVRALRWCLDMLSSSALNAEARAKHAERFTQKFLEEVTTLLRTVGCTDADCKLWNTRMKGAWKYIQRAWNDDEDESQDEDDEAEQEDEDTSSTDTYSDSDDDADDDDDEDDDDGDGDAIVTEVAVVSAVSKGDGDNGVKM